MQKGRAVTTFPGLELKSLPPHFCCDDSSCPVTKIAEMPLLVSFLVGYTKSMKTAVSIPDNLFEGAERLARRTNRSRSRLFSDALKEYLARHTPDKVTEAMDSVLADLGEVGDPFVSSASRRILERSKW
jgi:predicted transcriptional regulator